MHLACENPSSSCPVVLPTTYPPPRCNCQEDRSKPSHCRLCHLPFDIESRLRPDSGLRTFCSCFLGDSRVLSVCWMPVFYYLPNRGSPGDSGRSSSSRLSTESNHSLPSSNHSLTFTVDASLGENGDTSRKPCIETTLDDSLPKNESLNTECNHSLPSSTDASLEVNTDPSGKHCIEATLDDCLPKKESLDAECNRSLPSSEDTCLEVNTDPSPKRCAGETSDNCLPKDAITDSSVAVEHSLPRSCPADSSTALNYSSRDSIQDSFVKSTSFLLPNDNTVAKDSDQTLISDEAIQYKDSISLEKEMDSLNAREPVPSDGNNLEASRDYSLSEDNTPVTVDRSPLASTDNGQESASRANGPFSSAENGGFSAFENRYQYFPSGTQVLNEALREAYRPIFLNKNESNLNSSDPNTSCLGNRHQTNNYSRPSPQSFASFNSSNSRNGYGNFCNYAESRYPFDTRNAPEPNTSHSSQPNSMATESRQQMSSENSSVPPGFNPYGNLVSSNAGRGMSEINARADLGEASGFMGGWDLIQEVFNLNRNLQRNNRLAELARNMK